MARNARVVATTHYGELKEYAYARPGIENASVEFDKESLSPTYRIFAGRSRYVQRLLHRAAAGNVFGYYRRCPLVFYPVANWKRANCSNK